MKGEDSSCVFFLLLVIYWQRTLINGTLKKKEEKNPVNTYLIVTHLHLKKSVAEKSILLA